MWIYSGNKRPTFAETPKQGQESVWDYPRPPKLVTDRRQIVVKHADLLIADSSETYRILETAGPPTFYIPPRDVRLQRLKPFCGGSVWSGKGRRSTGHSKAPHRLRKPSPGLIRWRKFHTPRFQVIFLSIPVGSSVLSTASASGRSRVTSMEVGSPTKSSVRGKEIRELNGGSDVKTKTADVCCSI